MSKVHDLTRSDDENSWVTIGFRFLNVILVSAGITLIVISIWAFIEARGFILNSLFITACTMLLITGLILVILGIMALVGSHKRIPLFLQLYFVIICALTIFLITCVVCAFLFRDSLSNSFRYYMAETVDRYYTNRYIQESWDVIQSRFRCCGITVKDSDNRPPHTIWERNTMRYSNALIPESCCVQELASEYTSYNSFVVECQTSRRIIYYDDCYTKLQQYIKPRAEGLAYAAIVTIIFFILVLILTWILMKNMNGRNSRSTRVSPSSLGMSGSRNFESPQPQRTLDSRMSRETPVRETPKIPRETPTTLEERKEEEEETEGVTRGHRTEGKGRAIKQSRQRQDSIFQDVYK